MASHTLAVTAETLPYRFQEHLLATELLGRAARVIAAVSGGSDSTALVHLLAQLAARDGWALHAVHVRHLLRGQAAERDAEEAGRFAESLGLPFRAVLADVPAGRGKGESLEAAARRLRYAALLAAAEKVGMGTLVATGHTLDDQAETVLLNLARHAGRNRGGIRERRPDGVVRPLLPFRREELRSYLRERGISWREDETNNDWHLARNRIRHETLPALERSSPGCGERLSRAGLAWSHRLSALDETIEAALSERQTPLEGPWPRDLFRFLGTPAACRLLVRATGRFGAVPGRVQIARAVFRLMANDLFSESLAGGRIVAEVRAVRMIRPAKLIP